MSKSVGAIVLGVVGAVVGFFIGGPGGGAALGSALSGAAAGYAVGGLIDPVTMHSNNSVVGQRLDPNSLLVQSSAWGINIPTVFGRARVAGNVIWARPIEEVAVTNYYVSQSSGGKGGGSSTSTTTSTTYAYYGTFAIAVCAGQISNILKIWADTKLIYNIDTADPQTLAESAALPVVKYFGTETQIPSSIIEGYEGAGNVPGYRGLAYVVFDKLALANYGNRIPNITFEVQA